MPLSDAKARNAKPKSKPYKISDGEGLFLLITPAGGKYWRLRYFFGGKEKLLALGVYPEVSVADARDLRAKARKALANGGDPARDRKEAKRLADLSDTSTFESVAREWHRQREHRLAENTARITLNRRESHVLPRLGDRPIAGITAPEILEMLRKVEGRGTLETARRVMQICRNVFMYAIATGRAERNPVPDLQGALKTPVAKHHLFLKAGELPEYLQKLEAYDGHIQTRLALRFLLLTFVRTGELRAARWDEVDFDKAEWRIPAERMKMKQQHIVPLSPQSLAVLREVQRYSGNAEYIFPNQRNFTKCMSENTMLYALYRMGYHSRATGHGFRSTASTILNESGFLGDLVERQLAHCERDTVRAAYNYAQYLPERRRMMQWWADYLDEIRVK